MSKLEEYIEQLLIEESITFERQNKMPLDEWPWKKPRSHRPKCDFFLPDTKIYIEVKGFMTIHAMAKLAWLSRQTFRYYILQGTEDDWNPYLNSPLKTVCPPARAARTNLKQQVDELVWLIHNDPDMASQLSMVRIKDYIRIRVEESTSWNGDWF